jgi:hypothetical protein
MPRSHISAPQQFSLEESGGIVVSVARLLRKGLP